MVTPNNEAPRIVVTLIKSAEAPGAIGAPETSCVLTNAIFAGTSRRIRKLPVASQARAAAEAWNNRTSGTISEFSDP